MKVDISRVLSGLTEAEAKAKVAMKMVGIQGAKKMQIYAQKNARWTDRTGHARQRLTGYIEDYVDKLRICIAHGVNYGIYLEMCNEKRYAILQETVNQTSTDILQGFYGRIFS